MSDISDANDLLRLAKEMSTWIKGDKFDSLRIDCMNNIGIYSTTINVESKLSKWVERLGKTTRKFSPDDVYFVKVYGLKPIPQRIEEAVYMHNNEINLDLNKVLGLDSFRLEVGYRMNEEWLDGLIRSRSSPEPLQDNLKYHLSAQLKDPNSLVDGFSEFEVEEFPVTANVQIQENINMNIPSYVKHLSGIEAEILSDYDPRHGIMVMQKVKQLQKKKAGLKKKLGKKDLLEKLNEVTLFLRPTKFMNYIKMDSQNDFYLHNCEWGADLFRTLGMMAFPTKMKVITRTDLTLKNPATSGEMIYESRKFSEKIRDIFEKS